MADDGTADAALAGAHSAAGLELGVLPFAVWFERLAGDILAAAEERRGLGEIEEAGVEAEGCGEVADEGAGIGSAALDGASAGRGCAGAGAVFEGFVEAANAGRLAGAIYVIDGGPLMAIDSDEAIVEAAAEELRGLRVWHEAEATGEIVDGDGAAI